LTSIDGESFFLERLLRSLEAPDDQEVGSPIFVLGLFSKGVTDADLRTTVQRSDSMSHKANAGCLLLTINNFYLNA
jgi:hypothetical protein